MGQGWNDYERASERGPVALGIKIVVGVAMISAVIWVISLVFGAVNETATVAQKEFGATALLKKYEWFKDASAELDKKRADITVYANRLLTLTTAYPGQPRSKWAREDREQWNIWSSEVAGVRASYNQLAAEYNSEMSKWNWRFANAGELPKGAEVPLPREYKPYTTE